MVICLRGLNKVEVAEDSKSVTLGGGTIVKELIDEVTSKGLETSKLPGWRSDHNVLLLNLKIDVLQRLVFATLLVHSGRVFSVDFLVTWGSTDSVSTTYCR